MDTFTLNPESLAKILQLGGNQVETLTYLQSALTEKLKKTGAMSEFADLRDEVKKLVDNAVFQAQKLDNLDPWSGAAGLLDRLHAIFSTTDFSAFQEFMATKAAIKVPEGEITLDCMVSDKAEYIRAFSMNGVVLEGETADAIDALFTGWLDQPENKMIMQDGVIYSKTDKDEIAQDKNEGIVKERADRIRELLNNNSFEHYVQQKNPAINIVINQHVQPEAAPTISSQ